MVNWRLGRRWVVKVQTPDVEEYSMTGDAQEPMPLEALTIRSWGEIPRPVADVWAELMSTSHPAWQEPGVDGFELPGYVSGQVGSRVGTYSIPFPKTGIPQVTIVELAEVVPLQSRTVKAIAGPVNYSERVELLPSSSGTMLNVALTFHGPPMTPEAAERYRALATPMVDQWLERARAWPQEHPPSSP